MEVVTVSYNGSGTFQINTSGQPVVTGTVISSSAFNALTADLATGLSTAITKDGQTTATARIPFAQGITSTLVTDSSSTSTGSIITAGGVGIAKNLYVGVNANIAGTLSVTGSTTLTNPVINNIKMGYTTTATAAGTTTLTVSSNYRQFFTGSTTQTIVLPVTSTLVTGMAFEIENNSTGLLTVNSSGGNLVGTIPAGVCAHAVCIGTTLTTAADWDWDYISTTTITGTGANVLNTSPTITTPTIDTITSAAATALTLKSAGTTAVTVDTSQNVGVGTASPTTKITTYLGGDGLQIKATSSTFYSAMGVSAGASAGYFDVASGTNMLFTIGGTEKMRIGSDGTVFVNTTTSVSAGKFIVAGNSATTNAIVIQDTSTSYGAGVYFQTFVNSTGNLAGYVAHTGSTTVNFGSVSDYRLKEDVVPVTNSLAKICQLKPVSYKWKEDGAFGEGFIAHELQEIIPLAVDGVKDAVDTDNNIKPQGVDPSKVVVHLVAAIQEQQAIITALTARITALENK
jgi:hypothetical protein